MSDYIDREAVMRQFADRVRRSNNSDFAQTPTWNQAVKIVEDFPAADVAPVVRCGNCKHMEYDALFKEYWCRGRRVSPDFYCADGSEKEESKE